MPMRAITAQDAMGDYIATKKKRRCNWPKPAGAA
jgi:hypothetical protein